VRKVSATCVEHGGVCVAVASAGGSPHHPQWYYNLLAYRDVQLQDGDEIRQLHAREVFGAEKERGGRSPTCSARTTPATAPPRGVKFPSSR
jgi:deazaflavin-dependent oxidoreductase (nitroreductase family)